MPAARLAKTRSRTKANQRGCGQRKRTLVTLMLTARNGRIAGQERFTRGVSSPYDRKAFGVEREAAVVGGRDFLPTQSLLIHTAQESPPRRIRKALARARIPWAERS
jgi:hypothetical protein